MLLRQSWSVATSAPMVERAEPLSQFSADTNVPRGDGRYKARMRTAYGSCRLTRLAVLMHPTNDALRDKGNRIAQVGVGRKDAQ